MLQKEAESLKDYIRGLFVLAERCGYGQLKEELRKDRLVVSVKSLALSGKLQLIPDLTIDKAIEIARQIEAHLMEQVDVRRPRQINSHLAIDPVEDFLELFTGLGKENIVADVLSRSPRKKIGNEELQKEISAFIQNIEFHSDVSDK
ncbi:hypothetical protein LAZ67_X002762 [Cordylochernes scorpioides]|uniref:Uncharacterized protein n=1 Tax=Cordylochernes scorpioides TaxID=51811 RepID=A0ABY6LTM4_9ARAC|nr:hypothetical protein LAZ67_X002762 [Cordylochernes scorpioides]